LVERCRLLAQAGQALLAKRDDYALQKGAKPLLGCRLVESKDQAMAANFPITVSMSS
jgi:hypothetical protein